MTSDQIRETELGLIPSPIPEVDIWKVRIALDDRTLSHRAALLSDDEIERRNRAIGDAGKRRFTVARGLLRVVLGAYLDTDSAEVKFSYGAAGKPYIDGGAHHRSLRFNLAHSGSLALIAVTNDRDVGIDIEQVSYERDLRLLGEHALTRREQTEWSAKPGTSRLELFYRFWVRKEAVLKGMGTGLTGPIQRTDVSLAVTKLDHVVTVPYVDGKPMPWRIYDLELPGERQSMIAALAVKDALPESIYPCHPAKTVRI